MTDAVDRGDRSAIPGGSETLLLVEDEPALRRATRRALEGKGYRVIEAPDGAVGLELLRVHGSEIAMVISDLVMPNLDGRQLAEALRAQGSTIPILFSSGYSVDSVSRDAARLTGVSYLQKPWALVALFARVREVLDAAQAP